MPPKKKKKQVKDDDEDELLLPRSKRAQKTVAVWYQLYNSKGGNLTGVDKIEMASTKDLADFRKEVHTTNKGLQAFQGVVPASLVVFANMNEFDTKKDAPDDHSKLPLDTKLGKVGSSPEEPLYVFVPAVETSTASSPRKSGRKSCKVLRFAVSFMLSCSRCCNGRH